MKYFLVLLSFFSLTSCIVIVDELSLKSDGSGTFKYTINLGASKLKVNSVLALDSLNGKKVPSIADLEKKITYYRDKLEKKEGISNVKVESDFTNFVFKFQGDFTSVVTLQRAIKDIVAEENKAWVDEEYSWAAWDGNKFMRNNPKVSKDAVSSLKVEEIEGLKKGSYVSITRFDRLVERVENPQALISPDRMAVMLKTTPFALIQNGKLLENTIFLTPAKKEVKN